MKLESTVAAEHPPKRKFFSRAGTFPSVTSTTVNVPFHHRIRRDLILATSLLPGKNVLEFPMHAVILVYLSLDVKRDLYAAFRPMLSSHSHLLILLPQLHDLHPLIWWQRIDGPLI